MNEPRLADAARALRHVFVRNLRLPARIGVFAHEHDAPQSVVVSVDLAVDDDSIRGISRSAVGRDHLDRVVDYAAVAEKIRKIVGHGHVKLVETLAERIAEACLEDPRVAIARVRVEKPDALPDAASVGVEIERRRLG